MRKLAILAAILATQQSSLAKNVGIGTTAPNGKLHVKGNADSIQLVSAKT